MLGSRPVDSLGCSSDDPGTVAVETVESTELLLQRQLLFRSFLPFPSYSSCT
jgi:hypothetical protein